MNVERSTSASTSGGEPIGRKTRVPKMAELIAAQLRRQIVQGRLREGDALPPESALLVQFDVSRPTLREAFRVLESEALITVRRGANGGARVQVPDPEVAARHAALVLEYRRTTLADVREARAVLEPPCVALLAEVRTEGTVARLRAALAEHDEGGVDPARSTCAHDAFHAELVELTGNQTLHLLWGMLDDILDRASLAQAEPTPGTAAQDRAGRRALAAHHRVVDLIETRDSEGAEQLWRQHVAEARDHLLRGGVDAVLDLMG